MKVYVNPLLLDRLQRQSQPNPSVLTRLYTRPAGQCTQPLVTIHWRKYPEPPAIPDGANYVDILYRSAPDSTRIASIRVAATMIATKGKWQEVAKLYTIDNWIYSTDLI